jgi:hypothetical protein
MQGRAVDKIYVARVQGVFPAEPLVADVPLAWDAAANQATAVPGAGPLADAEQTEPAEPPPPQQEQEQQGQGQEQEQPEGAAAAADSLGAARQQRKAGKRRDKAARLAAKKSMAAPAGDRSLPKPAATAFRRLAVAPDGLTSLVECRRARSWGGAALHLESKGRMPGALLSAPGVQGQWAGVLLST